MEFLYWQVFGSTHADLAVVAVEQVVFPEGQAMHDTPRVLL